MNKKFYTQPELDIEFYKQADVLDVSGNGDDLEWDW